MRIMHALDRFAPESRIHSRMRYFPLRLATLFLLVCCLTAPLLMRPAVAQEGPPLPESEVGNDDIPAGADMIIVLNSGQRLRATFVSQNDDVLTVRIGAVETRIPRHEVDRVAVQRPAIERYREMRTVIEDSDIERLLALIEWSRANRLFDLALVDLKHVLALEPNNPEAIALERVIKQEKRLVERSNATGQSGTPRPATEAERPQRLTPGEFPLLSEEQVNLLKVWELDLTDPPRLLIPRDVIESFLDAYGDDPSIPTSRDGREAFLAQDEVEILSEFFRLRAREMYEKVRVLSVPSSLDRFRHHVNSTWLVNSCSTTRCHGGLDAGSLMLYNRDTRAERAAFTNFLILERSTMADGRALIDYEHPERSPLLQIGLPRQDSAFPHPDAYGWKPTFRTTDDRRFRQAIDWIKSMRQPRIDMPIEYEPPTPPEDRKSETPKEPQPR